MKLAVAIIFALIGSMVIADQVGKVCPKALTDVSSTWNGTACVTCPTDCPECNWNGKALSCIKCTANKFLKVEGETASCVKCADNCKSCRGPNAGDCIIPNDGYKLTTGGALFKCNNIAGCQFCSADDKCGQCEFGYFNANGTCTACGENCATCTSASQCTKCQYWYGLNNGTCAKCDDGCNECPCKACKPGYTATTDKGVTTCAPCTKTGCIDCSGNKDECKACAKTFQLKEKACTPCAADLGACSDCSADSTKCTTCVPPAVLNKDNKCVSCPLNCEKCSADGTCDTCKSGYYKSEDKKTCTVCPGGCKDNKCADVTGACSACADGFIMKDDKKTCDACTAGCKTCKDTTATGCTTCLDTFVNIQGACKTTSSKCQVGEMIAADDKCYNGTIDNCVYALNSSSISCLTCAKSYYNDGKSCSTCPVGCDECYKVGDYVTCSFTGVPQEYFSVTKSNGKKDLTGYIIGGDSLTAKFDYWGKSKECMPNNLLTIPLAKQDNTQCNTHETCTYPVKVGDMKWTCRIDGGGKNAVKVAFSVFAMAIAAIFAL